jgi:hypothetical protein
MQQQHAAVSMNSGARVTITKLSLLPSHFFPLSIVLKLCNEFPEFPESTVESNEKKIIIL